MNSITPPLLNALIHKNKILFQIQMSPGDWP